MSFGLSNEGFTRKRLPDIIAELESSYRVTFGADILTAGDSVFGQLIGITAEREAELWELMEAVYYSAYPDTAEGVSLANAAALTGITPLAAAYSTVIITATGTPGVSLYPGRIVAVPATGARFVTLAAATIGAGGAVDIACRAEALGPNEAPGGTVSEIITPVAGWASVTNATAAEVGRNAETDVELRTRRAASLVIARGGTAQAIEKRLREVAGVVFAGVTENRTGVTNGDGLPPKSLHAFVIGGDDQDVADMLWAAHPAGIETYGSETAAIIDSFGVTQPVTFSRGSEVAMYLDVELTVGSDYPADGDAAVAAALAAYVNGLANGEDVLNLRLLRALPGLGDLLDAVILQGTAPTPMSSASTAIAPSEVARISEFDITITHAP